MRLQKLLVIAGLSIFAGTALLHAQLGPNLVVNGSFEEPVGDNQWGRNPATWFAGQTFSGWTVTQGSVDIKRSGVPGVAPNNAFDGLQYVDLNGSPGIGGISQTITISDGGLYRLQFAMCANTGSDPNIVRTMRVTIAAGANTVYRQEFSWDIADHPNHQGALADGGNSWDLYQVGITLSSGVYTLSFVSTTEGTSQDSYGPLLDDVQLRLVPEPASLFGLGVGLAGLVGLKRRKR